MTTDLRMLYGRIAVLGVSRFQLQVQPLQPQAQTPILSLTQVN